jgi:hypothetical protein
VFFEITYTSTEFIVIVKSALPDGAEDVSLIEKGDLSLAK